HPHGCGCRNRGKRSRSARIPSVHAIALLRDAEACNAADRQPCEPSRSLFAPPPPRRRRAQAASAREHDEFRVAAGFPTEALVGHHQRRARNQDFADAVDRLRWNLDAVKRLRRARRRFGPRGRRRRLPGFLPGVPLLGRCRRLGRDADQVPAHAPAVVGYFHGGEDVRAQRLIGLFDDDRHVEERHKALSNENLLLLAAHEYRDLSARLVGWSAALVGAAGFGGSTVGAGLTASLPLGAASVGRGSPTAGTIGADAAGSLVCGISGEVPASLGATGAATSMDWMNSARPDAFDSSLT